MLDKIQVAQPNTHEQLFVIGGLLYRVNIHTQQLRVLNLIAELNESDPKFQKTESVAIIGGGFAGITAAAALQCIGKRVRLFERKRKLLPMQYYSKTRFLQPSAVNWPHVDLRPESDLPFLNWHCDFAHSVAQQVHRNFHENFESQEDNSLAISCSTEVTDVSRPGHGASPFEIHYKVIDRKTGLTTPDSEPAECIFFTSGFSAESRLSGHYDHSYWEDSSVRPIKSSLSPPDIAVVGDGDGAIIEVMRCFWQAKDLDEVYRTVANTYVSESKKNAIKDFDKKFKRLDDKMTQEQIDDLTKDQAEIYLGCLSEVNPRDFLIEKMEFDTSVTIYSKNEYPFSLKSSPIHKILLAFLLENNFLQFQKSDVSGIKYIDEDQKYYPIIGTSKRGEIGHDRIIIRIGPKYKYDKLVRTVFKDDDLEDFARLSNNKFDFSNPFWDKDDVLKEYYFKKDPDLREHFISEAEESLQSYLSSTLKMNTAKVAFRRRAQKCLTVYAGSEPRKSKRLIPDQWLGLPVVKLDSSPPRAKKHGQEIRMMEQRQKRQSGILQIHDCLIPTEIDSEDARFGVASIFLTSTNPLDTAHYALSARHAFPNENEQKVRAELNGNIEDIGTIADDLVQKIIDGSRFGRESVSLRDVGLIKLNDNISVENRLGDTFVRSVRSPINYALEDRSPVFINDKEIGELVSVRFDVKLQLSEDQEIDLEVFGVSPNSLTNDDIYSLPSGAIALDDQGNALGILVGSTEEEILFLDLSRVLSALNMKILPPQMQPVAA